MLAAIITYRDLNGDAPRIEVGGVKFLDGVPVEIEAGSFPLLILRKLQNNPFFEVVAEEAAEAEIIEPEATEMAAEPAKRRGRPPKNEKEAGE